MDALWASQEALVGTSSLASGPGWARLGRARQRSTSLCVLRGDAFLSAYCVPAVVGTIQNRHRTSRKSEPRKQL